MKNKLKYLVTLLIANFSFINASCVHAVTNDVYYDDSYYSEALQECDYCVCDAYRYVSVGVGPIVFIPNLGIGYRQRGTQFGFDTALSFSTFGYVHQLSAHLVGHYYLSPYQQNSAYLGLGLMGSGIITNHRDGAGTLSPDFVFGKELERNEDSRHFIEMHVAMPTLWMGSRHHHSSYIPLMYVKYGMSF